MEVKWRNFVQTYQPPEPRAVRDFFARWVPLWLRVIPLRIKHARHGGWRAFFGSPWDIHKWL